MCSRPFRPLGFAHLCRSRPRGSVHSLLLYVDHSHCPVLAPATLAALPSTRAIETRSLPTSLAATHRGFAFYVASPKSSIPWIATCSISAIPFLGSWIPGLKAWPLLRIRCSPIRFFGVRNPRSEKPVRAEERLSQHSTP